MLPHALVCEAQQQVEMLLFKGGQGKFHRGSDVLKNKEKVVRICQALLLLLLLSRFSRV